MSDRFQELSAQWRASVAACEASLLADMNDLIGQHHPTSLACDARVASPQPHPLRREVSPPGPLRDGDASGPGGVPNVP